MGKNVVSQHFQFAGTDAERLQDLQAAVDDESVKAIFCARGGYGTTRLLGDLSLESLIKTPKWIVGFSDVTALHSLIHNMGIESIHGIMPIFFDRREYASSLQSLKNLLFGEPYQIVSNTHDLNKMGLATGQMVGGNLTMIVDSIGTKGELDTIEKILFIEEVDEYLYHLDRMMVHLHRAGKLQHLAGLIVGKMSEMKDNQNPFGKSPYQIIHSHVQDFDYPICYDFPCGHEPENLAIPISREARLEVADQGCSLTFNS